MNWHNLVFSHDPRLRYRRHTIFWLVWLVYFTCTFFYKQQPLKEEGLILWTISVTTKSIFILFGHAFICYATMYFLLPKFLLKGKYFAFTGILFLIGIIITAWTFLCYSRLFPLLDSLFNSSTAVTANVMFWNSILTGLLSPLKLVTVAITIKLLKRWWLKQKENMRIEKEKISVELQLLKAQIHPDFLFSSLNNIYEYAKHNSVKASESLLKLSDMLSYMLYECDQVSVPLKKEIKLIRDYMELEKKRLGDRMDMDIRITGDPLEKVIAPLLLLPFIENSFQYCQNKNQEKCWINLDIKINKQDFSLKLINGKSPDTDENDSLHDETIVNVQKRLDIFYRDAYDLKITTEKDFMITLLKIQLDKASKLTDELVRSPGKSNGQDHFPVYATV